MESKKNIVFKPHHINAEPEDLAGNNGKGRYLLLPGALDRAAEIAEHFTNMSVKTHPRGHSLFLGTLTSAKGNIDVATINVGMGCPSMDIFVNELFHLGARTFLRIGTAGSLQPKTVMTGDIVIPTAAVRDESTSSCYIYPEYPAAASLNMLIAIQAACQQMTFDKPPFQGVIHTKDSLYAREMYIPELPSEKNYMENLKNIGVLATEMECSHLFTLASLFNYQTTEALSKPENQVLAGAILAVIGGEIPFSDNSSLAQAGIHKTIELGLATLQHL